MRDLPLLEKPEACTFDCNYCVYAYCKGSQLWESLENPCTDPDQNCNSCDRLRCFCPDELIN